VHGFRTRLQDGQGSVTPWRDTYESGFPPLPGRSAISSHHLERVGAAITLPDELGAFPTVLLPIVLPVVMDANALGNDLVRNAQKGRTVLVSAATGGALRLYCARHVTDEIHKHFADVWVPRAKSTAPELARLWASEYLPLLRCVEVPDGLLYPSESARIAVLNTPDHPKGDPDDVPTAVLALLLQAPLLSKDGAALEAVYGDHLDVTVHTEWLDALRAGGNLGPLGEYLMASYFLSAGIAVGTYEAAAALVRVVPLPLLMLLAAAGGLAFHRWVPPDTKAKMSAGAKTAAREGWDVLQTVLLTYASAKAQFEALAPDPPTPEDLAEGMPAQALLTRASMHCLARSRSGHMSAEQLSHTLYLPGVAHGEGRIREVLRACPAFEQIYRGRFQLGRALVRRASLESGLSKR